MPAGLQNSLVEVVLARMYTLSVAQTAATVAMCATHNNIRQ